MSEPLVSVAMAICDVDRFLAEAIESILGQSYRELEFIIVDFGSTDRSRTIAAGYASRDGRIQYSEIPKCTLPEARNAACAMARGQYIAVMDADDVSLPDRLQREVEFMESHPQVGLVGGQAEWVDASGRVLFVLAEPTEHQEIEAELPQRCAIRHSTVLIRTAVFRAVGGYRKVFRAAHDYDMFFRVAERFECANLREVVLRYRVHPHQVSVAGRLQQTVCKLAAQASAARRKKAEADPLDSAVEITADLLAKLSVDDSRLHRELASDCEAWIRNMFLAGEYAVALRVAREYLRTDLRFVAPRQIAELRLLVARLNWAQGRRAESIGACCRAVLTWPPAAGSLLRPVLRRLRLARG